MQLVDAFERGGVAEQNRTGAVLRSSRVTRQRGVAPSFDQRAVDAKLGEALAAVAADAPRPVAEAARVVVAVVHVDGAVSQLHDAGFTHVTLGAAAPAPGLAMVVAVDHGIVGFAVEDLGDLPFAVVVDLAQCRVVVQDPVLVGVHLLPTAGEVAGGHQQPAGVAAAPQLDAGADEPRQPGPRIGKEPVGHVDRVPGAAAIPAARAQVQPRESVVGAAGHARPRQLVAKRQHVAGRRHLEIDPFGGDIRVFIPHPHATEERPLGVLAMLRHAGPRHHPCHRRRSGKPAWRPR